MKIIDKTSILIIFLVFSNFLFGTISVFAVPLLRMPGNSILIIVFLRFVGGGIIMLFLVFIQLLLKKYHDNKNGENYSFFQTNWSDLKHYLTSKNARFFNLHRLLYLFLLGFFGITVNVVTYFIGLEELSIVLMLVGSPGGTIIVIAFYNSKNKEKLTLFKGVYLFMMFFALVITFLATENTLSVKATITGILALFVNIVALFILFVYMGRDSYARVEKIWQKKQGGNYTLMRTLVKLAIFMLFGGVSVLLLLPFGYIFPGSYFTELANGFLEQFAHIWLLLFNPNMIVLILCNTVLAYLLLFVPATFWDVEHSLSLDQWNSILYLLDPITGTTLSVALGYETANIPLLATTLVLLAIAILLRYVHEKESRFSAIIFIDVTFGSQKAMLQHLSTFPEIRKYYWTTGISDMMIKANFGSINEYYSFITQLGIKKEIKIKFDLSSFVKKCHL